MFDRLRQTYDAVAPAYEATFADELDQKPADRDRLAGFAASLGPGPVLDLGCGPGQVGAFVAAAGGRPVHGVDLSPAMAALAAHRLGGATAGDLRALPLRSGSVAGLVAFYSLIHLPRPELPLGFAELARVLRPDGRVLVAFHEGDGEVARETFLGVAVPFVATLVGRDEVVGLMTDAGLDVVAVTERDPYPDEHATVRLMVEAVAP